MIRYAPHAILIVLVLLLPLVVSILLAAFTFACYTAVVMVTFNANATDGISISYPEAGQLALRDVAKLLSF